MVWLGRYSIPTNFLFCSGFHCMVCDDDSLPTVMSYAFIMCAICHIKATTLATPMLHEMREINFGKKKWQTTTAPGPTSNNVFVTELCVGWINLALMPKICGCVPDVRMMVSPLSLCSGQPLITEINLYYKCIRCQPNRQKPTKHRHLRFRSFSIMAWTKKQKENKLNRLSWPAKPW